MITEQFRKNNPSNTSPSTKCHFFCLGKETRAGAVFPLNRATKGRDISLYKNPRARLSNVKFVKGPDGTRDGAVRFAGRRNSYVEFPNRGKLDAKDAITLLAWIYHEGKQGPIFNYKTKGWGVHFWMVGPRKLFARFMPRRGRRRVGYVASRRVRPRKWTLVGATYSKKTGIARLFIGNRFVAARRVGRFSLSTRQPVRMGAARHDRRYFKGRISCMQVYNQALNRKQIIARRKRCFRSKSSWKILETIC